MLANIDGITISQHNISQKKANKRLAEILNVSDLGHLDLDNHPLAIYAAGLAADYLSNIHFKDNIPLRKLEIAEESEQLILDQTTLKNLEITSTLAGEYEGSLLSSINFCRTAMGRRLLKTWILRPLSNLEQSIYDNVLYPQ